MKTFFWNDVLTSTGSTILTTLSFCYKRLSIVVPFNDKLREKEQKQFNIYYLVNHNLFT